MVYQPVIYSLSKKNDSNTIWSFAIAIMFSYFFQGYKVENESKGAIAVQVHLFWGHIYAL